MTTLKVFFTILIMAAFILPEATNAKVLSANKAAELSTQVVQEIKEVLKNPYLKFSSKNLNGTVKVITAVTEDGKIIFKGLNGVNEDLVSNVLSKLNSLNLWTSPDYSGKSFTYNIRYKN